MKMTKKEFKRWDKEVLYLSQQKKKYRSLRAIFQSLNLPTLALLPGVWFSENKGIRKQPGFIFASD